MAQILLPHFSRIFITTPGTFKASYPEKVFEAFCTPPEEQPGKAFLLKETNEALSAALEYGREKDLAILCTGSFYLAAEIRNAIKKDEKSSENSSQNKKDVI
jgi:folylpolyglutamate synthase/dihydropteroate synthase